MIDGLLKLLVNEIVETGTHDTLIEANDKLNFKFIEIVRKTEQIKYNT